MFVGGISYVPHPFTTGLKNTFLVGLVVLGWGCRGGVLFLRKHRGVCIVACAVLLQAAWCSLLLSPVCFAPAEAGRSVAGRNRCHTIQTPECCRLNCP